MWTAWTYPLLVLLVTFALAVPLGLCALLAIIRGLRGDKHMGNFYVDLWRGVVYWYVPICLVVGVLGLALIGLMFAFVLACDKV